MSSGELDVRNRNKSTFKVQCAQKMVAKCCDIAWLFQMLEQVSENYNVPSGNYLWSNLKNSLYYFTRKRALDFSELESVVETHERIPILIALYDFIDKGKANSKSIQLLISAVAQALSGVNKQQVEYLLVNDMAGIKEQFLTALEREKIRLEQLREIQLKKQHDLERIAKDRARQLLAQVADVHFSVLESAQPLPPVNCDFNQYSVIFQKSAKGGHLFWYDIHGQKELIDFKAVAEMRSILQRVNDGELELSTIPFDKLMRIKQFCKAQIGHKIAAIFIENTDSARDGVNYFRLTKTDENWCLVWVDGLGKINPIDLNEYEGLNRYLSSLSVTSACALNEQQLLVLKVMLRAQKKEAKKLTGDYSKIEQSLKAMLTGRHRVRDERPSQGFEPGKLTGDYSAIEAVLKGQLNKKPEQARNKLVVRVIKKPVSDEFSRNKAVIETLFAKRLGRLEGENVVIAPKTHQNNENSPTFIQAQSSLAAFFRGNKRTRASLGGQAEPSMP